MVNFAMQSLKGSFLIASPQLADPNFVKTVVLMVQHNDEGALGLILNRPLEVTIQQACEQVLGSGCEVDGPLHQGGPCEAMLMVLHTDPAAAENEVIPGLYFTTARDRVEQLLESPGAEMKFFVGYAGWGPGQLEEELKTGSWLLAGATPERVFGSPEQLWSRLNTEAKLNPWIDPKRIPDDPSVN